MRRTPTAAARCVRKAAAALALTASALTVVPFPSAQAGPTRPASASPGIAELRAEVARTGDRLAAASVAWERGQQRLGQLLSQKVSSERELDQLGTEAIAAQRRSATFASDLYKNPYSPMLLAVLHGSADTVGDLLFVRRALSTSQQQHQDDLTLLSDRQQWAEQLVQRREDSALAALRLQSKLDDDLTRLQADALASLGRLQAAVAELRRRQDAAAAAAIGLQATGSGATCDGPVPDQAINGFLPASALCRLESAPGHRLVASAASAFDAMSTAFEQALGRPICVTDSYRDYAGQVQVFSVKPNLAATPGRSQHGWGRAVDLCGGVQTFGTPPYNWLKANSATFGFIHPDWAEPTGSRPEPWHWEFVG